ncbi:MAG TPA: hypothetical protein VE173_16780 [Longimicrobiales bacterium]|nr:hypothetical protein [Longimicrobiales bacterium]
MIETILKPNWIKDTVGVLLLVVTGALYAAGVTHAAPCDCGAAVGGQDGAKVEAVDGVIDVASQSVAAREI